MAAATLRWVKRCPAPTDAVAAAATAVATLAAELPELSAVLPLSLRSRILTAEARARSVV